jgi:hypothetical protein
MSREKTDTILKVLVKHFFAEKEVTSTLVMDSMYSGLKSLEYQSMNKKCFLTNGDEVWAPYPMVYIDQDAFVLADDVVALIERAVSDTWPQQTAPAKDEKGSQNRTKVEEILHTNYMYSSIFLQRIISSKTSPKQRQHKPWAMRIFNYLVM